MNSLLRQKVIFLLLLVVYCHKNAFERIISSNSSDKKSIHLIVIDSDDVSFYKYKSNNFVTGGASKKQFPVTLV